MDIKFNPGDYNFNRAGANSQKNNQQGLNTAETSSINNSPQTPTRAVLPSVESFKLDPVNKALQKYLLRELIDLPKEWDEFLQLFNQTETMQNMFEKKQIETVNLLLMKTLIADNSKEAVSKFLKLVQANISHPQNSEQLSNVLSSMKNLLFTEDTPLQHIIKEAILLYLPFAPLPQPLDLNIEVPKNNKEEKESQDINSLVLYISTKNVGRFKINLILDPAGSVIFIMENNGIPDEYAKYLIKLDQHIRKVLKSKSIESKSEVKQIKVPVSSGKEHQSVTLRAEKSVPSVLMNAAFIISSVIFDFDQKIINIAKKG